MASVSSLGVGSGIDVRGLVDSLVSAEGAGKATRLDIKEAEIQAKLSAMSALKSALSDFKGTFSALKLTSSFNSLTTSSSDSSIFTATSTSSATAGSYDIEVNAIATAQKLQTAAGYATKTESIGEGTLTFSFASDPADTTEVEITDGSLQGIKDAINSANIGVSANIVYDGANYQMVLTSQTGTENDLTITATSTSGDLSPFIYDVAGGTTNLNQTQASTDALVDVEGVAITSSSNTISTAIEGVTLSLVEADIGTTHTLSVSRDTSSVEEAVQGFVDGYNALMETLNQASFYNADTESAGILIGDATVRGIVRQVRSVLNSPTVSSTATYNSLASIGILTARDGSLEYDPTKLSTALSSKPDEVRELLAGGNATASDSSVTIQGITENTGAGSIPVELTAPTRSTYSSNLTASGAFNFDLSVVSSLMQVTIGGNTSANFSFAGDYSTSGDFVTSGNEVAAAIQAAINADATISANTNGALVSFETDNVGNYYFDIKSSDYGSATPIVVNAKGAGLNTNLGFTVGAFAGTTGVDGAGTIGGLAATFEENVMTGTGLYSGFVLATNGESSNFSINVTSGQMASLDSLITSFLDDDGLIDAKTDGLNASIKDISNQRVDLERRLQKLETRLISQFSAMDATVAQLNSTSSFLTNQLESLSNLNKR